MTKQKLLNDIELLKKQKSWLDISLRECKEIGIKKIYTIDEFGKFETLCSRYSRTVDFLIRKFFRTLDWYEFENQGTLIDIVNNAHKRGLFEDIDEMRMMKDIRNSIVHEYIEDELVNLFEEVLVYSDKLLEIVNNSLLYTKRYF